MAKFKHEDFLRLADFLDLCESGIFNIQEVLSMFRSNFTKENLRGLIFR